MTRVLIDNYPHRMAGHCGSGALRDLMEWAGLGWDGPPDEALVFGMGGGLSFMYMRYPGLTPPFYLVGRNADMELDFCRRLGITTQRLQNDDPGQGWQRVKSELDANRPVMIWADIAELPYLRVRLSNTRHSIVVVGYDDDKETVLVADNDREDLQEVPMAAFHRAHGSQGFPGPNRFATYPMEFPGQLPDLLTCARDAAASAVRVMEGEDTLLFNVDHLPQDSLVAGGIEGVRTFADDLKTWPYRFDPEELATAVKVLPVFIEKAGTGGGLFRLLEADFCREIARLTGDSAFSDAGDAMRKCAEGWSALGHAAAAENQDINNIIATADRLPALEQEALDRLKQAAMIRN